MSFLFNIKKSFSMYLSPQRAGDIAEFSTGEDNDLSHSRDSSSAGSDLDPYLPISRTGMAHSEIEYGFDEDTLPVGSGKSRKRKGSWQQPFPSRKMRRMKNTKFTVEDEEGTDFEGSTLLASTPSQTIGSETRKSKKQADRELMPPPATPKRVKTKSEGNVTSSNEWETDSNATTDVDKRRRNELDDYDIEQARRYAEAVRLPANSGIWAEEEKDLFYRLALRGFEPLLPENWMLDFKTLPLSLYANAETPEPLIHAYKLPEFRAIKALADLIGLGRQVRDHYISNGHHLPQRIIEQQISQYITWALTDVGINPDQQPDVLSAYAITRMKRCKTTQDAIRDLANKLHDLASQWRNAHDVIPSIEEREMTPTSNEEKTLIADAAEDDLPILTGILICSSLVMIVTLNPHNLAPPSSQHDSRTHHMRSSDSTGSTSPPPMSHPQSDESSPQTFSSAAPSNPHNRNSHHHHPHHHNDSLTLNASGLRFIATFDFSSSKHDVWNGLAVAIVVMSIRSAMLAGSRRRRVDVTDSETGSPGSRDDEKDRKSKRRLWRWGESDIDADSEGKDVREVIDEDPDL